MMIEVVHKLCERGCLYLPNSLCTHIYRIRDLKFGRTLFSNRIDMGQMDELGHIVVYSEGSIEPIEK